MHTGWELHACIQNKNTLEACTTDLWLEINHKVIKAGGLSGRKVDGSERMDSEGKFSELYKDYSVSYVLYL
jgi:hypothetical protein